MSGSEKKKRIEENNDISRLFYLSYPKWTQHLYVRPLFSASLFFLLFNLLSIAPTLIWGGFSNTQGVRDVLEDGSYPFVALGLSLAVFFYLYFPKEVKKAIGQLHDNKVFPDEKLTVSAKVRAVFTSKWTRRLQIGAVVGLVTIWSILSYKPTGITGFFQLNILSFSMFTIALSVGWLASAGIVVNIVLLIALLNNLFQENRIVVHKLHPDGSGGFNPIGKLALKSTYPALAYGATIISWIVYAIIDKTLSTNYLIFFNVGLYLMVVPILFFLPLQAAHKAMLTYRDDLIHHTSELYFGEQKSIIQGEVTGEIDSSVEHLDALARLHEHQRSYPTWPFNTRIRQTVIFSSTLPLLTTIVGFFIDILGSVDIWR